MSDLTDEEMEAALARSGLDQSSPAPDLTLDTPQQGGQQQPHSGPQQASQPDTQMQASEPQRRTKRPPEDMIEAGELSQTLQELQESDASLLPKVRTVCENCPNSVWFRSTVEVKCYCRVMFIVTYSNKEQNSFVNCDGLWLGQEDEG